MLKKIVLLMVCSIGYVDAGGLIPYTNWKNRAPRTLHETTRQFLEKKFAHYPKLLEDFSDNNSEEDKRTMLCAMLARALPQHPAILEKGLRESLDETDLDILKEALELVSFGDTYIMWSRAYNIFFNTYLTKHYALTFDTKGLCGGAGYLHGCLSGIKGFAFSPPAPLNPVPFLKEISWGAPTGVQEEPCTQALAEYFQHSGFEVNTERFKDGTWLFHQLDTMSRGTQDQNFDLEYYLSALCYLQRNQGGERWNIIERLTGYQFQAHAIFPMVFNSSNFNFILEKVEVIRDNTPTCVACSFSYPDIGKTTATEMVKHLVVFWPYENGYIYFDPNFHQYIKVRSGQQLYQCLSYTAMTLDYYTFEGPVIVSFECIGEHRKEADNTRRIALEAEVLNKCVQDYCDTTNISPSTFLECLAADDARCGRLLLRLQDIYWLYEAVSAQGPLAPVTQKALFMLNLLGTNDAENPVNGAQVRPLLELKCQKYFVNNDANVTTRISTRIIQGMDRYFDGTLDAKTRAQVEHDLRHS